MKKKMITDVIILLVISLILVPIGCQEKPEPTPAPVAPVPTPPESIPAPTSAPTPVTPTPTPVSPPPAIDEPSLSSVKIPPVEVPTGETQQLEVIAIDEHGNRMSEMEVAWIMIDKNAGSITRSGLFTAGEVTGNFSDAVEVQVSEGEVIRTATASVTITPGLLEQVVIAPNPAEIGMEMTQQFVAIGADQYGNRISDLAFSWSVENGSGIIDKTGLFTAGTIPGTYEDTVKAEATLGSVTRSCSANVTVEPDRIMYWANRGGEPKGIYLVDDDSSNVTHVASTPQDTAFSISLDGRRIILSNRKGIMIMDADGSGLVSLIENDSENINSDPNWSSDGNKIVFVQTTKDDSDIYVMDVDSGNLTQLTDTSDYREFDPKWSPDGSKIVFIKSADDDLGEDDSGIYIIDADGSNVTQVTDTSDFCERYPKWSPDGNQILFSLRKGIHVVNVDGSDRKRLRYLAYSPVWSPDGTKIAFTSDSQIYVMKADGTKERYLTLTDELTDDIWHAWSPDGSKIVFVSKQFKWTIAINPWRIQYREHKRYEIYVVDAVGGNKILLTDLWDEVANLIWVPRKRGVVVTEDSVVIPGARVQD